jgi:predicted outer membrane repeat protein
MPDCLVHVNQNGGDDQNTGSTWAAAKATIQGGIDTAIANPSRCNVWVAQGTYRPTYKADPFGPANTTTLQMRPGIAVYGGFAGDELAFGQRNVAARPTIIDGAPDAVTRIVTAADGARLDGFTVDGGDVAGTLFVLSGTFEVAWCTVRRMQYTPGFSSVGVSGTMTITDSLFLDSTRALTNGGSLVVRRSEFRNNHIPGSGGAISSSGTLEISDSTFVGNGSSNDAGGNGGAIDLESGSVALIERSTFRDNLLSGDPASTTTTGLAFGAAINASSSNTRITIRDSTFEHNVVRGRTAGGGAIRGKAMTIVNSRFLDNHAEGTVEANGGAVYSEGALDVVGGSFRGNSAQRSGGAVRCTNRCRFAGTSFDGNAAARSGGALYRSGTAGLSVASCAFSNNTAGMNGGAIANYNSAPSVEIDSSTFFGNAAASFGGGLYNDINNYADVSNSIFWANSAGTQGAQIYNSTNVVMTIASSNVQGSGFSGAGGNIDADPQFLNTTPNALDLRLNAGSPSVSTGNVALLPLDMLDMDADANVAESLPLDLARNARVLDPALDMGCFER